MRNKEDSCMAKSAAPEPGTPEYQQWLIEHSKPLIDRLFEHPIPEDVAQAEDGLIAGPESWDQLMPEKTIPEDIAINKAHQSRGLKLVKK
jgi:hypothetical protein